MKKIAKISTKLIKIARIKKIPRTEEKLQNWIIELKKSPRLKEIDGIEETSLKIKRKSTELKEIDKNKKKRQY